MTMTVSKFRTAAARCTRDTSSDNMITYCPSSGNDLSNQVTMTTPKFRPNAARRHRVTHQMIILGTSSDHDCLKIWDGRAAHQVTMMVSYLVHQVTMMVSYLVHQVTMMVSYLVHQVTMMLIAAQRQVPNFFIT